MIHLAKEAGILNEPYARLLLVHSGNHLLAYERGGLVFVFNFHPQNTYTDYVIPVSRGCDHEMVLSTDDPAYGGFGNLVHGVCSAFIPGHEGPALRLTLPPRTACVWRAIGTER